MTTHPLALIVAATAACLHPSPTCAGYGQFTHFEANIVVDSPEPGYATLDVYACFTEPAVLLNVFDGDVSVSSGFGSCSQVSPGNWSWEPKLTSAFDSFVTIGGEPGPENSTVLYDGPCAWGTAIPVDAYWFNFNPPNLQGASALSVLAHEGIIVYAGEATRVARFVMLPSAGAFSITFSGRVTYNGGLGTPASQTPSPSSNTWSLPCSTGLIASPFDYPTALSPSALASGDVDLDGDADLIVACQGADTVQVSMNLGAGEFGTAASYAVGDAPRDIVLRDLDGDLDLDIAVANTGSSDVTILRNTGGSFTEFASVATGSSPRGIDSDDFDGDGDWDLVVANLSSDDVSILENNGDATFAPQVKFGAGNGAFSVAAGDLNVDGVPDLAVANLFSDDVSILIGLGDGSFLLLPPSVAVGLEPVSIELGDFDGDGDADLAVANQESGTVSILLNNGRASFVAAAPHSVGISPATLVVGDLYGEGALDVAVTAYGDDAVSMLRGGGDGAFSDAVHYVGGDGTFGIFADDLDGDGQVDVLATNYLASTVSILFNLGPFPDDDGDGAWNCEDICPGFDDTLDSDDDGIPNGCEEIVPCPADLNDDGVVNGADLGLLLAAWGSCG